VETHRATDLPVRARAAGWSELYGGKIERVDFVPDEADSFDAQLGIGDLGPLRLARLSCGPGAILRAPAHIGHVAVRTYSFILLARGRAAFVQYGHEAQLAEGDLVLCDGTAPYSLQLLESCELVMLRAPAQVVKEHLPSPEFFCGRRLAGSQGVTSTIASLTLGLCARLEAGLAPEFASRFARHLLDMIATSYAEAFDKVIAASSIASGRQAKVKLYIEQHLRDPELTPRLVAERLRLSSRYLRMIFASASETVSAYILRRRLEECARQMADPRWRGHSITEIAFSWGFNSAPHFTRSFRNRFGISPRGYRRGRLDGAPAAAA
jgi:AraC family transcriptional activator of tynA and feaB